jgi:hypothetical protein
VRKLPFAVRPEHGLDIVGGVAPFVTWRPVTDFEIRDFAARPIHQLVGETLGRKACAHPWGERDLALVRHQGRVAFKNIDKLILFAVPMKQS